MLSRFVRICIIAIACAAAVSSYRTHAEEGNRKSAHPWIRELVNHADDLNLSADQKSKLGDLSEGPQPKSREDYKKVKEKVQSILSKEQWEKMEGVFARQREERQHNRNNNDDNDDHK